MTDQTITVNAGPPQQIGANLNSGYTIRNQSTTTAVWVSSQVGVTPGYGQKIGALGSLLWNGGPCYAALDTATGSATLSMSTSTQQITDPVAIAQAVNAQGIPNVLTGAVVLNPSGALSGGLWSVGSYASLSMTLFFTGQGQITLKYLSADTATVIYTKIYTIAMAPPNAIQIVSNVYGPTLQIGVSGTLSLTSATIYGSNRSVQDKCITDYLAINNGINQTWTANTQYTMGTATTPGGMASFNFRITPALQTNGCRFGFQYWDLQSGVLQFMQITNSKAFQTDDQTNYYWSGQFLLPPGIINFQVVTDATIAGIAVFTAIMPTS